MKRWLVTALCLAACSNPSPAPSGPVAKSKATPEILHFAHPDTRMVAMVSLEAARSASMVGVVLGQQAQALAARFPSCEMTIWDNADTLVVALGPASSMRLRVLGSFDYTILRRCLESIASDDLGVEALAGDRLKFVDADGEVTTMSPVPGGIELRKSTDTGKSGGPTRADLLGLLENVDLEFPLWVVSVVDESKPRMTESGTERFETGWLDLDADSGVVTLRLGMTFFTEEAASGAPEELLRAVLTGIGGRFPVNLDSMRERLEVERDGRRVDMSARWTVDEIDAMLAPPKSKAPR